MNAMTSEDYLENNLEMPDDYFDMTKSKCLYCNKEYSVATSDSILNEYFCSVICDEKMNEEWRSEEQEIRDSGLFDGDYGEGCFMDRCEE